MQKLQPFLLDYMRSLAILMPLIDEMNQENVVNYNSESTKNQIKQRLILDVLKTMFPGTKDTCLANN